jgi:hypothetical protein
VRIGSRLISKRSTAREDYRGGAGFIEGKGRLGTNERRTDSLRVSVDQLAAAINDPVDSLQTFDVEAHEQACDFAFNRGGW